MSKSNSTIKNRLLNPKGYRSATANPSDTGASKEEPVVIREIRSREGSFGNVVEVYAFLFLPGSEEQSSKLEKIGASRTGQGYAFLEIDSVSDDLQHRFDLAETVDFDFYTEDFLEDVEAAATEIWRKDDAKVTRTREY
jgi:hypothetical protein